jgi:hypothetical protein
VNRHIKEPSDLEQLLREPLQLRDAGFSQSVMQRVERYQLRRRFILSGVWLLALTASSLTAVAGLLPGLKFELMSAFVSGLLQDPWQFFLDIIAGVDGQISEYTAVLSPARFEYSQAPALLQDHGVLLASLAALLIVFFARVIAQD